jgi:hypothetical protein
VANRVGLFAKNGAGQADLLRRHDHGRPSTVPSFDYGTLAGAGVPAVLLLSEANARCRRRSQHYQSDGTITIYVLKALSVIRNQVTC